jgi:hypothetical protein
LEAPGSDCNLSIYLFSPENKEKESSVKVAVQEWWIIELDGIEKSAAEPYRFAPTILIITYIRLLMEVPNQKICLTTPSADGTS